MKNHRSRPVEIIGGVPGDYRQGRKLIRYGTFVDAEPGSSKPSFVSTSTLALKIRRRWIWMALATIAEKAAGVDGDIAALVGRQAARGDERLCMRAAKDVSAFIRRTLIWSSEGR